MNLASKILIVYLLIINIAGFVSMGIDKYKAKKHRWRIQEKSLFLFAIAGGSIGSIIGMHYFHHKTKHWYFVIGMPAILVAELALALYLWNFR